MKILSKKLQAGLLTTIFALFAVLSPAGAYASLTTASTTAAVSGETRLAGVDRYETAAKIAQAGWTSSEYAVLSAGSDVNLVDALTAAPLAKYKNAPILLTQGNALSSQAEKELIRLGVRTVYVTSGTAVIKQAVLSRLSELSISVFQLGGSNRYETAINIAKKLPASGNIVIASASSQADALSVSAIAAAKGMPILLTDVNSIPSSVSTYVNSIKDSVSTTYVIGGQTVISEAVRYSLPKAERVAGSDRYATNREIIDTFYSSLKQGTVFIANGQNAHLVDSLAGAPYAALTASPIILTDSSISQETKEYVKKYLLTNKLVALGGENFVAPSILSSFTATLYTQDGSTQGSNDPANPVAITDCIRVTGDNITLQNITADYSIYIQGDNATLNNVTVKGSIFIDPGVNGSASLDNVNADKVVVLSGGENSIHITESECGELVVTTSNAAGEPSTVRVVVTNSTIENGTTVTSYCLIDAQTGADLGTITVTSLPGETPVVELSGVIQDPVVVEGQATLVAAEGAVVPNVIISTSNPEQIVTLEGAFESVEVNAEAQVVLGEDTTVETMVVEENSTITVPPSATIDTLEDNSTESTVAGGGEVNGEITPDSAATPPAGGGAGGGTQISLSSVVANSSAGDRTPVTGVNTYTFDLSGQADTVQLEGLTFSASQSDPSLVISSITARGVSWVETGKTITAGSTNGVVTVNDIFGGIDSGNDGISMQNLRLVFGTGTVQIVGKLTKTGYTDSTQITVNIILGGSLPDSTTISNQWMDVVKTGAQTVEVRIQPGKGGTKIGDMTNGGNFNFTQVVAAIALSQVDYSSGDVAAANLKTSITSEIPAIVFDNITLSMLAGKSVQFTGGGVTYTVTFIQL